MKTIRVSWQAVDYSLDYGSSCDVYYYNYWRNCHSCWDYLSIWGGIIPVWENLPNGCVAVLLTTPAGNDSDNSSRSRPHSHKWLDVILLGYVLHFIIHNILYHFIEKNAHNIC